MLSADHRSETNERLRYVSAGCLFKLALDFAYVTFLTGAYSSHFLTPFVTDFSIFRFLESYIWVAALLYILPCRSNSAAALTIFSGVVFLYVPIATIYGLDSSRSRLPIALTALALVAAFAAGTLRFGFRIRCRLPANGRIVLLIVGFSLISTFLTVAVVSGAFLKMNLDISEIYNFRADASYLIDIGILAYTNLWAQKVFTPLILAIGLQRRSGSMIVLALSLHFLYFGITQHRSHIFAPILVLLIYYMYKLKCDYAHATIAIAIVIAALNIAVFILDLQDTASLTIRRAFFVGASVAYSWVEYFDSHAHVYFADNILSRYVHNSYTGVNLPKFMGDMMRIDMDIAFNSGLVGAGFAQLGFTGVLFYAVIVGLSIRINARLLDAGVPPYLHASVLFWPYRIAWADADLMTALLSHGIIIGTFALWLYGSPRTKLALTAQDLQR